MTDLSLRERLARNLNCEYSDQVMAELLSYLSDNGLAIVPVKCSPLVRASMEDELTEQYAQSPQWEEAEDVVECWSAPFVYEAAIKAAPPAADLLRGKTNEPGAQDQ